ncbi:hypothetical protein Lal_00042334 [Lupinus albus]|nr:hypothetical protein Lal_00042334 [Lupinus albus]
MAEHRPKRVKTIAIVCVVHLKKEVLHLQPQAEPLEKGSFIRPGATSIKIGSFSWQKTSIYSLCICAMVSGASNFVYKNGRYITMVKGKLIVLDEELFLAVGGLSSSGEPLGNCENEQWVEFEALATHRSCLRDIVSVTPGGLTKVGALTVENRLLHYVIAYILVHRNTNHAQPTTNDLKMIFAIKQGILVNWPVEILRVMSRIATSSSRLLAYGIFISRIIDHTEIDTSNVEIKLTNTHDHQLGEYLIHKMGIYNITGTWMYQEDYRTTVDLDLSDQETPAEQQEQPTAPPEAPEASQAPPFGLAHLDALEQRLNQRVDAGLQALNDNLDSGLMNLYDRVAVDIQREND